MYILADEIDAETIRLHRMFREATTHISVKRSDSYARCARAAARMYPELVDHSCDRPIQEFAA